MKKIMFVLIAIFAMSCTHTKINKSLPFATVNREGAYPVRRNKEVKNKPMWTFRNYRHEGR